MNERKVQTNDQSIKPCANHRDIDVLSYIEEEEKKEARIKLKGKKR